MFHLIFPRYSRSTLVQPLVFTLSAVFFLVFDAAQLISGQQSASILRVIFSLTLIVLFVAAGWLQVCEYVFLVCYFVFNLFNLIDGFEMVSFALSILMIFWLIRSWIVPAVLVFVLDGVIATAVSLTPGLEAFSSVLTTVLVLAIGLVLRWQNGHRVLAEQEKERTHRAASDNRKELARQLHDTTAKDLAHVAVLAQDMAARHPELSSELSPIVAAATEASRRIRPMILSIDAAASDVPLSKVVDQVMQMLKTRHIELDIVLPDDLDCVVTRQQQLTGALAIRECGSNMLKYAPADSEAHLVIDIDGESGVLTISLSNEIASVPAAPDMSSGYGLANLGAKIRAEGGSMEVSDLGNQWLTYITIPSNSQDEYRSGSLRRSDSVKEQADD
ncbi:sensor histidine kinase [Canibacter zhoujuaniae]|uniref:sensor histidine kinase n=1 Tax=Canibacter zhoujuaniae TaxID=2708343 RepID=UPI001423741D|nr:histidine kinase [Canibacter zhoujuaniae]